MNPIFPLPITHPVKSNKIFHRAHYPLANKPSCRLNNSTIQQFNNLLSLAHTHSHFILAIEHCRFMNILKPKLTDNPIGFQ